MDIILYIHGDSKNPNCLYHIHVYLMPDHIILKHSSYSENGTNNMIQRSVTFYSVDKKIRMFEVTGAYDCEFQQVFYGVRCGFDAWPFTFGLH